MGHDNASPQSREHLQRAVKIAGGQHQLAALCGVSQTTIWRHLHHDERVSAEMAARIVAATSGEVTFAQLSPDIFAAVSAEVARESAS